MVASGKHHVLKKTDELFEITTNKLNSNKLQSSEIQ